MSHFLFDQQRARFTMSCSYCVSYLGTAQGTVNKLQVISTSMEENENGAARAEGGPGETLPERLQHEPTEPRPGAAPQGEAQPWPSAALGQGCGLGFLGVLHRTPLSCRPSISLCPTLPTSWASSWWPSEIKYVAESCFESHGFSHIVLYEKMHLKALKALHYNSPGFKDKSDYERFMSGPKS